LETQFACFLKQGKKSGDPYNITVLSFSGFIIIQLIDKMSKAKVP
jgi:hypothetical protein